LEIKSKVLFGSVAELNAWVKRPFSILIYFSRDIYSDPLILFFLKYHTRYLTPCCGLEVKKLRQVLKSAKGLGNIFDINPKWATTLPSIIYFSVAELNAWVVFCTSSPQLGVIYQL
jgi:hypothetical protein